MDLPLSDPFVIAAGQLRLAENVFVRVTLGSGAHGYGEIAPFPGVGGEERNACTGTATALADLPLGEPASHYRRLATVLEATGSLLGCGSLWPGDRAAGRLLPSSGGPTVGVMGCADVYERETDITITITDMDRTLQIGRLWYSRGFRILDF